MGYKRHKCIYQGGNDQQIPDSAFNVSSWLDGIYTRFDPTLCPDGWPDIQPYNPEPGPVPPEPSASSGELVYSENGNIDTYVDGNGNTLIYNENEG
jgi:hypothetical protein